jgi:hypothetical protein
VILGACLVVSCASGPEIELAAAGVSQFHDLYASGSYREIFAGSDEAFQRATTQEQWVRLLESVHTALGTVEQTSRIGTRVVYGSGSTTVAVTYATRFSAGTGTEDFTFIIREGAARLRGYQIGSDRLK